jgi:hypothetical protein
MDKAIRIIIGIIVVGLIVGGVGYYYNKNKVKQGVTTNLNSKVESISAKNTDGTMGPGNSNNNFAKTLSGEKTGKLTFYVTDPDTNAATWKNFPSKLPPVAQNINSLVIQIKKIEVYLNENGGHWETLDGIFPFSIDLLQLTKTDMINLGTTTLSVGKYSEVRFYIEKATAALGNGNIIDLNIPNNNGIVRVVNDFNMTNANRSLILDFDGKKSVTNKNGSYDLTPYVSKLIIN